jgi:hypothetical protein
MCQLPIVTSIAEELDWRIQRLDAATAAHVECAVREVLALAGDAINEPDAASSRPQTAGELLEWLPRCAASALLDESALDALEQRQTERRVSRSEWANE